LAIKPAWDDLYADFKTVSFPDDQNIPFDFPVELELFQKKDNEVTELLITSATPLYIGDLIHIRPKIHTAFSGLKLIVEVIESDKNEEENVVVDEDSDEAVLYKFEWTVNDNGDYPIEAWEIGRSNLAAIGYGKEREPDKKFKFAFRLSLKKAAETESVSKNVKTIKLPEVMLPELESFSLLVKEDKYLVVKGAFKGFAERCVVPLDIELFSAEKASSGKLINVKKVKDLFSDLVSDGSVTLPPSIYDQSAAFESGVHGFSDMLLDISIIPATLKEQLVNTLFFAVLRIDKGMAETYSNFANLADYKVNAKDRITKANSEDQIDKVNSEDCRVNIRMAPFGTFAFASKDVLGTGVCSNSQNIASNWGELEEQGQYLSRVLYRGGIINQTVQNEFDSILAGTKTFTPSTAKLDTSRALQRALFFLGYPLGSDGSYTIDSIYNTGSNMGMAFFLRENKPELLTLASTERERDLELLKGPQIKIITINDAILQALFDAVEQAALDGKVYGGDADTAIENLDLCDVNTAVSLEQFYSQQKSAIDAAAVYGQSIGYPMTARWIVAISYTEAEGRPRPRFELKVLNGLSAHTDMGKGLYPFTDFRFLRLAATSFGHCHVMGQSCGPLSWQPVKIVNNGEGLFTAAPDLQFKVLVEFCKYKKFELVKTDKNSITANEVVDFSKAYNGEGYAKNSYHIKTAANYNESKPIVMVASN
jgi:hypothetical protein